MKIKNREEKMIVMNSTTNPEKSSHNPVRLSSLGLFIAFKTIFETIILLFKYAFRGIKFLTVDLFLTVYNHISRGVDNAHKATKKIVKKPDQKGPVKEKREHIKR